MRFNRAIHAIAEPAIFLCVWIAVVVLLSWWRFAGEMNGQSTTYILVCLAATLGGRALSSPFGREPRADPRGPDPERLRRVFIICLVVWAVALAYHATSLLSTFDLSDPIGTKNLATEMTAEHESSLEGAGAGALESLVLLLYVIGFPSLFLGALLAARGKYRGYAPVVMGALTSLLTFSRFHMFVYLVLFAFTFIIAKTEFLQSVEQLKRPLLLGGALAALLFLGPAAARSEGEVGLLDVLMTYLFGGVAAFSQWFAEAWPISGDGAGRSVYSLTTWLAKVNLASAPPPIHLPFTAIGEAATNVYTAFRLLLEDWGPWVTPLIFASFGFVSAIISRLSLGRRSWTLVPLVAYCWAIAFFSFYTVILVDFRMLLGSAASAWVLASLAAPVHPESASGVCARD